MSIADVQHESPMAPVALPRLSLEMAGLLIVGLGAWGGIVPFVGPLFGYGANGTAAWTWNLAHALVSFTPGVACVYAGILVLAGTIARERRSARLVFAGLLAVVGGAWFVVGPFAWPVLQGTSVFAPMGALRALEFWVGYSLGPGALLIGLGAFVIGRPR